MTTLDKLRGSVPFGRGVFKKMSQTTPPSVLAYGPPSSATIIQPGIYKTRQNEHVNTFRSNSLSADSSFTPSQSHTFAAPIHYSSSASTSTTAALSEIFIDNIALTVPSVTPLDNYFHNLNAVGIVASHWKHYKAFTTVGEKEASLLLFEQKSNIKAPARLGRINRLCLLDLLRYDIGLLVFKTKPKISHCLGQLVQLAHPRILRALHPLTEDKNMIAFACEPIYTTLDCFIAEKTLEKLEIKLGVLQLIEGLSYLHNSAKILHGNLTPASVFVTAQQHWKIANFSFAVIGQKPNVYKCYPWTKRLPICLQPDLDFLAPEYLDLNNHTVTTAADVFSLGVLICWLYANGKRIIDVKNNLESYQIVIDQLDVALELLDDALGANLKQSLIKVLSKEVEQRPAVQLLALIKHFDDSPLAALRQLDDIAQEFDPANKTLFLSQSLFAALPNIPEPLWFSRILQRFNEHLLNSTELYPAILRLLIHILNHCESHNIYKLRPWFRQILDNAQEKALSQAVVDNMPIIFQRLNDEKVEGRCFDLLIFLLTGQDPHLKQTVLRALPHMVDFIPLVFINQNLIPTFQSMSDFFEQHIPRQIDLLVAIAHLSDRCDVATLNYLLSVASVCNALHPAVVHSKSRLVQRILTCDVSRLKNPIVIAHHLLNPLVLGLALPKISMAHFDDVMSSTRILLDIIEQLRYESNEFKLKNSENERRLCKRRVSMSSNHLPRLLITAARLSFGGDGRKMSFLSADGRLEDRSRRESKDSRCSLESDVSLRIGNSSDISDDSAMHASSACGSSNGRIGRRRSWLEGYMHSVSLEQASQILEQKNPIAERHFRQSAMSEKKGKSRSSNNSTTDVAIILNGTSNSACGYNIDSSSLHDVANAASTTKTTTKPPTTFTNLGHNLACTLWKTFY